jgi:cation diffusion facilitator CzcD-associated flavoprotein CzcO
MAPMTNRPDVIVIGAGPYGLAAAAQLRSEGVDAYVFGEPMSFWKGHMPKGMLLRSPWGASHIGDPNGSLSLDEFERLHGSEIARPIPLATFVAYGQWFQHRMVPDLDHRRIQRVDPIEGAGFRVTVDDGEVIICRRVVIAAGIAAFAWRPPEFDGIPSGLASHSNEHVDLGHFAGANVVVIGGGQSALESAVLLGEAGARVEVIMRAPALRWVGRATRDGLLGRVFFHRTDVGPAVVSQIVARPRLVRRLPVRTQRHFTRRSLAAGAALWLRPRMGNIGLTFGRRVTEAARSNGHLRLRLDDGSDRSVDHVMLATGYHVDIGRYPFLAASLVSRIRCVDGHPVLDEGLQSSIPGLHFLGAPAVHSFGPLVRFVAGTDFAARTLARSIRPRRVTPTVRGDRGALYRASEGRPR